MRTVAKSLPLEASTSGISSIFSNMSKEDSSDHGDDGNNSDDSPPRRRCRFLLPAWLNHFNSRDLKVFCRCLVALWVSSLLIFISPALHSIGIATFFGTLLLYIVPPSGILFVYLIGALSLLFGMCLAWAWGLLTMKAALAARPDSQTQARLQQLQREAAANAHQSGDSVSWAAQVLVHQGFMLDARVTVVFYVMACIFVYVMARVRVANPKLTLAETFGNVITNLFLLFGPTLPSFNAMLAKTLVEPGAIGLGLGAACCVLFFPQSTSHAVLEKMEQIIRMGESSLQTTQNRLAGKHQDLAQLQSVRAKTIGAFKAMQPMLTFLPLDFSRCRWSAEDVRGLGTPVRQAMMAHLALLDYNIARVAIENEVNEVSSDVMQHEGAEQEGSPHSVARRHLRGNADLLHVLKSPELGTIRSRTVEMLQGSTAEALQVTSECINFIATCVHTVNARRWFGSPPQERFDEMVAKGEDIRTRLRSAREICIAKTTEGLIESHAELFNENGQLKSSDFLGPHALRGLILGMVVEEDILVSATTNEDLLVHVLQLLKKRRHNRIWLPSGLRYAISWLANGRHGQSTSIETGDNPNIDEQANEVYRQLRFTRGYGPRRHQALPSRLIRNVYNWLTDPGGIYALRMVVVTIATAIPASLPASAGFFYRERGIWGVITAQIAVLVYMSDFTFSLLGRATGTVAGGIIGMVAWYIGSGHGTGNAYGLAAITAAVTAVLVWWRLFLPPLMTGFAVLSGATFSLVMGFSYDDAHMQQYGLPGHGYKAFYKRVVTVLLGLVAASVVQVFPRPPSANRHIRMTLSNAVHTLSDHYALLLSHWDREDTGPVDVVTDQIHVNLAESLLGLQGPINLLKFELSLGSFDQETLRLTQRYCQEMNKALARLLGLSDSLPQDLQKRLVIHLGFLDDHIVSAVMAVLEVVGQALRSEDSLPERLPTPLVNRAFEFWHAMRGTMDFSLDMVRDENYRRYCVAVSSYLRFLSAIDDLVVVLKAALGESHIVIRPDQAV